MKAAIIIVLLIVIVAVFATRPWVSQESFGGTWHSYVDDGDGMRHDSILVDPRRKLLMLTFGPHTQIYAIHSLLYNRVDDRGLPAPRPDKVYAEISFGPNLDILRIYQPTCGIMSVRLNNGAPRTFYPMESSAMKYPTRLVKMDGLFAVATDAAGADAEPFALEGPEQPATTLPMAALASGGKNPLYGAWFAFIVDKTECPTPPCEPLRVLYQLDISTSSFKLSPGDLRGDIYGITYLNGVHTMRTSAGEIKIYEVAGGIIDVKGVGSGDKRGTMRFYRNLDNARMNAVSRTESFEIGSALTGDVSVVNIPSRLGVIDVPEPGSMQCRPPILPLRNPVGSAAVYSSRELGVLS